MFLPWKSSLHPQTLHSWNGSGEGQITLRRTSHVAIIHQDSRSLSWISTSNRKIKDLHTTHNRCGVRYVCSEAVLGVLYCIVYDGKVKVTADCAGGLANALASFQDSDSHLIKAVAVLQAADSTTPIQESTPSHVCGRAANNP